MLLFPLWIYFGSSSTIVHICTYTFWYIVKKFISSIVYQRFKSRYCHRWAFSYSRNDKRVKVIIFKGSLAKFLGFSRMVIFPTNWNYFSQIWKFLNLKFSSLYFHSQPFVLSVYPGFFWICTIKRGERVTCITLSPLCTLVVSMSLLMVLLAHFYMLRCIRRWRPPP